MTVSQGHSYIERAGSVLRALAEHPHSGGVAELSRTLGISRSAVHRVLQELVSTGLVAYVPQDRSYTLGPASVELSLFVVDWLPIRQQARPFLYQVRDITDEAVGLLLRMGHRYAAVEQIFARRVPTATAILGQARALRYGASGRVILAFQPDDYVESYLERLRHREVLPSAHEEPGDDIGWLEASLAEIREQGFGISLGENGPGLNTLAFPVQDAEGLVSAAISVMGTAQHWTRERMLEVVPECLEAIRQLESRLGVGSQPD